MGKTIQEHSYREFGLCNARNAFGRLVTVQVLPWLAVTASNAAHSMYFARFAVVCGIPRPPGMSIMGPRSRHPSNPRYVEVSRREKPNKKLPQTLRSRRGNSLDTQTNFLTRIGGFVVTPHLAWPSWSRANRAAPWRRPASLDFRFCPAGAPIPSQNSYALQKLPLAKGL